MPFFGASQKTAWVWKVTQEATFLPKIAIYGDFWLPQKSQTVAFLRLKFLKIFKNFEIFQKFFQKFWKNFWPKSPTYHKFWPQKSQIFAIFQIAKICDLRIWDPSHLRLDLRSVPKIDPQSQLSRSSSDTQKMGLFDPFLAKIPKPRRLWSFLTQIFKFGSKMPQNGQFCLKLAIFDQWAIIGRFSGRSTSDSEATTIAGCSSGFKRPL